MKLGQPVRYIPGVGAVILEDERYSNKRANTFTIRDIYWLISLLKRLHCTNSKEYALL
jgi:hypothetical protein